MTETPDGEMRARVLRRRVEREALWMPVEGSSMGRAIGSDSRVLVTSAPAPRRGEVWAFVDTTGAVVVHRHRSSRGRLHWFRGDATERDDPPIPDSMLLGRVVCVATPAGTRRVGRRDRVLGHVRLDLLSARTRAEKLVKRS